VPLTTFQLKFFMRLVFCWMLLSCSWFEQIWQRKRSSVVTCQNIRYSRARQYKYNWKARC